LIRFGEGDLDEVIHVFRANVANDSDTVLVLLSHTASLEIGGTGGASFGVVFPDAAEFCRSGEPPFTLAIQDFGLATRDFLLPNRSSFGLSSFDSLFSDFPVLSFPVRSCFGESAACFSDTLGCAFSVLNGAWSVGRLLKLADLGSSSSCWTVGRLWSTLTKSGIFGEEWDRVKEELLSNAGMVNVGPCMTVGSSGCKSF